MSESTPSASGSKSSVTPAADAPDIGDIEKLLAREETAFQRDLEVGSNTTRSNPGSDSQLFEGGAHIKGIQAKVSYTQPSKCICVTF